MITRLCLTLLSAASSLAVGAAAAPQQPSPTSSPQVKPQRIPSKPKHGGTLHVATGTWTRRAGGQRASLGPHVIYSNTAPTSYFSSAGVSGGFAPGATNYDEGSLPGTFNTGPFAGTPTVDAYNVTCVSIGYCDMGPAGSSAFHLEFFSSYAPCSVDTNPDAELNPAGLPAGGGCWVIDLDLGAGLEFCLQAEGEGVFDADPSRDSFGWSFEYAGIPGTEAGFMMAGNPVATDPGHVTGLPRAGSNTYYGATQCVGVGSGYLTADFWWLEDPTGMFTNCYFFGGYANNGAGCAGPVPPPASFHLELAGDLGICNPCLTSCAWTTYCYSNPNSTGVRSALELEGSAQALDNNLTLRAFAPPNVFGFFITSQTAGFVANPAGSEGNLCLGGQIGRFIAPGQIKNSGSSGVVELSTMAAEWSLTAIPDGTGFYAAAPGLITHFQFWHRDVGNASNFSNAILVGWQ